MGIRFRKSLNLGSGVRVNLSKKGVGASIGTKGARITKTANGRTRRTLSIPNTGISYVSESGSKKKKKNQTAAAAPSVEHGEQVQEPKQCGGCVAVGFLVMGIAMIVLGALLAFALPPVGIAAIVIGIIEIVVSKIMR